LSTQKYPKSSKALVADDIPEPLKPVIITMSGPAFSEAALSAFLAIGNGARYFELMVF
jgi:hypothetical protein